MSSTTPRSTAKIAGRPIHPMTVALPITLLVGTAVCDVLFYFAREPLLATVALYALGAGIVFAALAMIAVSLDDADAERRLYQAGALLVTRSPILAGCGTASAV